MSKQGFRQIFKWDDPNLKELNDMLRWLYSKVTGRVEMRDLSTETKTTIDSKADGAVVGEIKDTADQAKKDADAAAGAVFDMQGDVEQAKQDSAQAKADSSEALSKADEASEQVVSMQGDVEQAKQDSAQAKADSSEALSKADEASKQVVSMKTSIEQNEEAIRLKADKTVVDALNGTVSGHSAQIELTAEQISSTVKRVDELDGTVSEHSTAIIQTAEKIESTAKSVETLDGKVTEQETKITQTADMVEIKADKETVDELRNTVAANAAELVVQADEIALRVKQETLDAAIDGVQVGGRNLIRTASDDLITISTGGILRNQGRTWYCASGYHLRMEPYTSTHNIIRFLTDIPVKPNEKYVLSFYLWTYGIDVVPTIRCNFLGDSPDSVDYAFKDIVPTANTPVKYTVPVTIPSAWTASQKVNLRFYTATGGNFTTGYVYFSDVKLEAGTKATDWTPAPEDGELAVKKLEAELSVQAGKISANTTKIETANQSAAAAQSKADANAADLTAVTKRVTTAEVNISALDEEISSKVSQTDFNALGNRVSSAESAITQQAGKISANATAVQTAQTAADAAQSTANAAQAQANTNKTGLSGVTTRVTTAEANLSALAGKISTKVEKSEFDELGNIVSQQGTKIEQTDEQVLILAGQRIGGTNLIRIGTDDLISLTVGTLRREGGTYYHRSGLLAQMQPHSGNYNILMFKEGVKVRPGSYMLSFWCWTYGIDVQPTVRCNLLNMDLTRDHYFKDIQPTANTPVRYEIPVEVTYTDTMRLRFVVPTKWTAGNLFFSDVKLEEGDKATAWSPCPDDPAGSVNAGGVVRVDQTGVHMRGGVVEMETSDGDEFIHITNSGISASSLEAPNVAKRYAGPAAVIVKPDATSAQIAGGGYFRSLPEACAALSGRYLDKAVTITVSGTTYGDAYLRGVTGFGSVTVTGGGNILYGSLSLLDNTAEIWVNGLKIVRSGSAHAFAGRQYGMGWARWYQCVLDGNGGDQGILTDRGARAMIWSCELYNAAKLLQVGHNANVSCIGLRGGGGTNFLHGDGGLVTWGGTRPDGVLSIANPCLREPYDLAALPIDYGTAQPSAPVVQTAAYSYLYSDSHVGGWGYFDNDDIYQGIVRTSDAGDTAAAYGVIWFDQAKIRAALNGKTINQVSLRLHMHTGVGRGSAVSVQLYGTNTAYDGRSGAPALTASYGDIGSTNPGETAEITIPAQAVSDLVSGTICALVLKSSDAELYKDRDYSRNYARFSGTGSATAENCPRLTVVYQ